MSQKLLPDLESGAPRAAVALDPARFPLVISLPPSEHVTPEEVTTLLAALGSESQTLRFAAAEVLVEAGEEIDAAMRVLVEALHSGGDGDSHLAATALVTLGARAVPPLEEGLQDPLAEARRACAHALGEIGPRAVAGAEALAEAVTDESLEVRAEAARAIGRMGTDAVPFAGAAIVQATTDESALVRYAAASALLCLGHELGRALGPLTEALRDDNVLVRRSAADALGGMGTAARPAIPELTDALEDPDAEVRASVIRALGEQGQSARSAFPQISVIADDASEPDEVRQAAEEAMERIV